MRAADVKKINKIEDAVSFMKRNAKNVRLNLDTAVFQVRNSKDEIVKEIAPKKGNDAAYIINNTTNPETLQKATDFIKSKKDALIDEAGKYELEFSEKQNELLKAVSIWRESNPGASRRDQSIRIGRLQTELAHIENKLRGTQYKQRGPIEVLGIKRRTYVPASNDERVLPFDVFRLLANETSVKLREI